MKSLYLIIRKCSRLQLRDMSNYFQKTKRLRYRLSTSGLSENGNTLLKSLYLIIKRYSRQLLSDMANYLQKISGRRYSLGITGLSQSGKTTFITSLLNQLSNHDRSSLQAFSPVFRGDLIGVKIRPLSDGKVEFFPYEEAYRAVAGDTPNWPESTSGLSGCVLEVKLQKKKRRLNPFSSDTYIRYIEIRDYPGEWLLDLPLIDMDYLRWCNQCSAQYSKSPRTELLGPLLSELQNIDPLEKADLERLAMLSKRFKAFLVACKSGRNGLSLIQPGRFLIPGEVEDEDILDFIPLLKCGSYTDGQLRKACKNSYFKVCGQRYDRYVKELVEPFYRKFCQSLDRQIVLVDVVNALNGGPEYVDDMRQALANIADSFSYGSVKWPLKPFVHKIDRVVFAASKVDQVVSEDHDKVRQLLAEIVRAAYKDMQYEGVEPVCEALAAVRSSRELRDRSEQGIAGYGENGAPVAYVHPEIPSRIPSGEGWRPFIEWQIPRLSPPKGLSASNNDVIPHIRLDTVINALIGDICK